MKEWRVRQRRSLNRLLKCAHDRVYDRDYTRGRGTRDRERGNDSLVRSKVVCTRSVASGEIRFQTIPMKWVSGTRAARGGRYNYSETSQTTGHRRRYRCRCHRRSLRDRLYTRTKRYRFELENLTSQRDLHSTEWEKRVRVSYFGSVIRWIARKVSRLFCFALFRLSVNCSALATDQDYYINSRTRVP